MRVFSVEMLVKEEGAAVVQAALGRLKKETAAVAAEMKATTAQVTSTGRAMQQAGQATEIAKDRAAKAAIGFAAVGQSFARTGTITADMGTRIIEAGSQIATMFGPTGLAVGALLGFAAAAVSSFTGASTEAKKMREEFEKQLAQLANSNDLVAAKEQLRDLMYGTAEGAIEVDDAGNSILNMKDGMIALQREITRLNALPFSKFVEQRDEIARLNEELKKAAGQYARLQDLIFARNMPSRPEQLTGAAITIGATAPRTVSDADRRRIAEAARYGARLLEEARNNILREKRQFQAPSVAGYSVLPPDFIDSVTAQLQDTVKELERKSVDILLPVGAVIASGLGEGIANAIKGGITSGLEMAIASGNIGDAFRAMGQAIVQSLASAMVDVAIAAIGLGTLLESIQTFMTAHPALAVASAVALLALAKSMGGSAKGSGMTATGGVGGLTYSAAGGMSAPSSQIIFGGTSATTAAGMTPRSATNVTIIGPNDPTAQRAMQELLAKANSRGRIG